MAQSRDILNVSINDDGNLFVACLETGIRVYNMEPLVGKLFLDAETVGSVSICKLLHRTNLIALVGGGQRPKFADNTVLIWDDQRKKFVLEFTFPNRVLSLRTRRDRLFVVERFRIHCFSFPNNPVKLFTVETRDNPQGICEITPLTNTIEIPMMAFPGHRIGSVQLLDLSHMNPSPLDDFHVKPTPASSSVSPSSVSAHTSEIASIALNRTGTLLATASRKGTLIRIFRTVAEDTSLSSIPTPSGATVPGSGANPTSSVPPLTPVKIMEFRRGIDQAMVYGIVFSADSEYLLVSSDKGTVHIFALKDPALNRRSTLSQVPLVNIQTASYALAKFTLAAECACVCSFGAQRGQVFAVCVDGTFWQFTFKNDGSCIRENFDNFLNVPEEADHILL